MSRELFNTAGKRLYLTDSERKKFLAAADDEDRLVRSFCYVLAHTGCRISEALQLHAELVDFAAQAITFESLKKRKRGVYRAVPVPPAVLEMLAMVHGLKDKKKRPAVKKAQWERSCNATTFGRQQVRDVRYVPRPGPLAGVT